MNLDIQTNCGIKATESEYAKGVPAPNLVFFDGEAEYINAGGVPIYKIDKMIVELYCEKNDFETKNKFEKWLAEQGANFANTDTIWLTKEKWYLYIYEVAEICKI